MLKLEVGKFYMMADGEIVKIVKISDANSDFLWDSSLRTYHFSGRYNSEKECECDLIEEIPKELHQHLIKEVMNYWQDEDFRKTVDSVYGCKE